LHGAGATSSEISPNLWRASPGARGAGTALVGDPATVAARIREYQKSQIDTFHHVRHPHSKKAYRFAELVFSAAALAEPGEAAPLRVN